MRIIGGRSPLARFEMGALQDMDATELLRPITKFAKCVHQTERIPEYISMAFRAAMTGRRGPAFLEIPTDVLFRKVEESTVTFPKSYRPPGRVFPDTNVLGQATETLRKAERPLIMAGSAIYWSEAHEQRGQRTAPEHARGVGGVVAKARRHRRARVSSVRDGWPQSLN